MEESAVTIGSRPEVHEGIKCLIRDLMELQIRNEKDLTEGFFSTTPSVSPTGQSKFERLPRLALPEFDRTPVG